MKQERELECMMERHKEERRRREKDKNSRISKYINVLQEQVQIRRYFKISDFKILFPSKCLFSTLLPPFKKMKLG